MKGSQVALALKREDGSGEGGEEVPANVKRESSIKSALKVTSPKKTTAAAAAAAKERKEKLAKEKKEKKLGVVMNAAHKKPRARDTSASVGKAFAAAAAEAVLGLEAVAKHRLRTAAKFDFADRVSGFHSEEWAGSNRGSVSLGGVGSAGSDRHPLNAEATSSKSERRITLGMRVRAMTSLV